MVVSPSEGVVPCGGNAALTIHFNPDSVVKFDTRIKVKRRQKGEIKESICMIILRKMLIHETCVFQIALRNMKSIEFRVVGSVEPPDIDISVVSGTQRSVVGEAVETFFLHGFVQLLMKLLQA